MPVVTRTSNFHRPAGTCIRLNERGAIIYVLQQKIDKHLLGSYLPAVQGFKHTGIMTDGEDLKLYRQFGAAFEWEFNTLGRKAIWMELMFRHSELEVSAFGINVITQQIWKFNNVLVGASVEPTENRFDCNIYINHGPLINV